MKWHKIFYIACIFAILTCFSCTNNPANDEPGPDIPTEDTPLSGSWVGYFLAGQDDLYIDGSSDTILEYDSDDIFTIAIITLEKEARFIGDVSQFLCPEGDLVVEDVENIFKRFWTSNLYYYTWDTTGNVEYLANRTDYSIYGSTFLTNMLIDGLYQVNHTTDSGPQRWQFELYNYQSTGVYPDARKFAGEWKIERSFTGANTLTLIITTSGENPGGIATISGTDLRYNHFTGTISIHIDTENPHNVIFDVSMMMNGSVNFEGLATYIENMNSGGLDGAPTVHVEKTLAIGATATDAADSTIHYLLNGLAKKVE